MPIRCPDQICNRLPLSRRKCKRSAEVRRRMACAVSGRPATKMVDHIARNEGTAKLRGPESVKAAKTSPHVEPRTAATCLRRLGDAEETMWNGMDYCATASGLGLSR